MQGELAGRADRQSRGQRRSRGTSHEARLQALLAEELASAGADLAVVVDRGCGTVEVRVSGPAATLTLAFDAQEAQPAHVRLAVRAAIARYGASLGAAPHLTE